MKQDSEGAAHSSDSMEGQSQWSQRYLLLYVWCGVLTVSMVVMAALLVSIKPTSAEDGRVSTLKPEDVGPTAGSLVASLKSAGTSASYIQLTWSGSSWWPLTCPHCSLVLKNDSILCTDGGTFFIYAQVTFRKPSSTLSRSVILRRNAAPYKGMKKLAEGTFPHSTEGSVWVASIVRLLGGESISIHIQSGDYLGDDTFWGAYQLH
ncbi:lymphotoxin-alpha [Parambassis ranga]|uniref:Lymphotoxin-alpha n=1 Tax=Parambassis ranga TaxID=210632 RepID=A0A6P7HLK9_9TELE|nr:uncharacterized protein LOC114431344 [Parambassis ranga]